MLLVVKHYTFDKTIKNSDFPLTLMPVSNPGNSLLENMERMDEVVWASRESGCGTIGIEGALGR